MKPMLATDYVEAKLRFPLGAMPKVDGVRGLNSEGVFFARSMKQHANLYTRAFYSQNIYNGLDGELAAEHECHPDLCRLTTSATSTIEGQPYTLWHIFDQYFGEGDARPYKQRYDEMKLYVEQLWAKGQGQNLRIVPLVICNTLEELLEWDAKWLEMGYEGTIIRDLDRKYKEGRSTVREMGLLRIKRFIDGEAVVLEIHEGEENQNEAQVNELGQTYRSTHQENMVPNGMVGRLICRALNDITDPSTGNVVIQKDQIITVSPGKMSHDKRRHYFENQGLLLAQIVKFKFFPKGIKDKPRFPVFVSTRAEEDM